LEVVEQEEAVEQAIAPPREQISFYPQLRPSFNFGADLGSLERKWLEVANTATHRKR